MILPNPKSVNKTGREWVKRVVAGGRAGGGSAVPEVELPSLRHRPRFTWAER